MYVFGLSTVSFLRSTSSVIRLRKHTLLDCCIQILKYTNSLNQYASNIFLKLRLSQGSKHFYQLSKILLLQQSVTMNLAYRFMVATVTEGIYFARTSLHPHSTVVVAPVDATEQHKRFPHKRLLSLTRAFSACRCINVEYLKAPCRDNAERFNC